MSIYLEFKKNGTKFNFAELNKKEKENILNFILSTPNILDYIYSEANVVIDIETFYKNFNSFYELEEIELFLKDNRLPVLSFKVSDKSKMTKGFNFELESDGDISVGIFGEKVKISIPIDEDDNIPKIYNSILHKHEDMDSEVRDFLNEIEEVCNKHGLSISHEDGHGAFEIEEFDQKNIDWLRSAHKNF